MTTSIRGPIRDDALQGKRILITGGGTGLGKELARSFVVHGAAVHICGRREGVLQEAVAGLPRGFEAVRSTVMDGALYATLACGRRWIAQSLPGSVVSMLVTWVWTGSPFVLPSVMAKTAVHAMTMSLAVEWGRHNIRVNAVAPGLFPTESAWEKLAPIPKANVGAASSEKVPMGRYGKMDELCNLLLFLQSDGCDYITGQNIAIDGGHHLAAPSTFAEMNALTPEDWAEAKRVVRARAEQEKAQRSARSVAK
jgi:NAD(P)-dependent dehydrogenase (short-subunit alcohol dehydrogenase family)